MNNLGRYILAFSTLALFGCKFEQHEFWYDGRVNRGYAQVDRVGLPGVGILMVNFANSDQFNAGDPETDVEEFTELFLQSVDSSRTILDTITGFPATADDAATPEAVAATLLPDVFSVDLEKPLDFAENNGRRLGDQAMDVMLNLVYGQDSLGGDLRSANDFLDEFPYLNKENID